MNYNQAINNNIYLYIQNIIKFRFPSLNINAYNKCTILGSH